MRNEEKVSSGEKLRIVVFSAAAVNVKIVPQQISA